MKSKDLIEELKLALQQYQNFGSRSHCFIEIDKMVKSAKPFDTIGDLVLVPKDSLLAEDEFKHIGYLNPTCKLCITTYDKLKQLTKRGD